MITLTCGEIIIYLMLFFVGYTIAKMFCRNTEGVKGVIFKKVLSKCTDIAKKKVAHCGSVRNKEDCVDHYTTSGGEDYFCVPDDKAKGFTGCKQDDETCPHSDRVRYTQQYLNFMKGNKTFEKRGCQACGGCGEFLGDNNAVECRKDNTKWCRCVDGY
jgi:hypothetical protein